MAVCWLHWREPSQDPVSAMIWGRPQIDHLGLVTKQTSTGKIYISMVKNTHQIINWLYTHDIPFLYPLYHLFSRTLLLPKRGCESSVSPSSSSWSCSSSSSWSSTLFIFIIILFIVLFTVMVIITVLFIIIVINNYLHSSSISINFKNWRRRCIDVGESIWTMDTGLQM